MTERITINAGDLADRAADRIEQADAWTQNTSARDSRGEACSIADADACQWCATGAIWRECWEVLPDDEDRFYGAQALYDAIRDKLGGADGPLSFPALLDVNDAEGATAEQAVAGLRYRAEKLDAEFITLYPNGALNCAGENARGAA